MTASQDSLFDLDLNHALLKLRRTKIVATVGPATNSPELLEKFLKTGVDVIRVNFSHGVGAEHVKLMALIRETASRLGLEVGILADLCGPKVRVGSFVDDGVQLIEGSEITITTEDVLGTPSLIPSQYKGIVAEAELGARVLLDDGNLELKITKKEASTLKALVVRGGLLKNKKGMNLPDTAMQIPALTEKDRQDVLYALEGGADYLALSFVRHPKDIQDLKDWLGQHQAQKAIIAKIEKPEALESIAGILEAADGIMVARGDLGVELPATKVPHIQDKLIKLANRYGKPVIVATQMLESMIDKSRPTRAEVTDVAAACRAGADAVMLSAETASGAYPFEAVNAMDDILRATEAYRFYSTAGDFSSSSDIIQHPGLKDTRLEDSLRNSVALLSRQLMVRAVLALTWSGRSAWLLSAGRPEAPVLALTHDIESLRRLKLGWGIYPQLVKDHLSMEEYIDQAEEIVKRDKLGQAGDYLILLSGPGEASTGGTNAIHIHRIRLI